MIVIKIIHSEVLASKLYELKVFSHSGIQPSKLHLPSPHPILSRLMTKESPQ